MASVTNQPTSWSLKFRYPPNLNHLPWVSSWSWCAHLSCSSVNNLIDKPQHWRVLLLLTWWLSSRIDFVSAFACKITVNSYHIQLRMGSVNNWPCFPSYHAYFVLHKVNTPTMRLVLIHSCALCSSTKQGMRSIFLTCKGSVDHSSSFWTCVLPF